jgi:2-hydroxy-3-keto-5-methylthiopentenyl-1-phosphate phosphatase
MNNYVLVSDFDGTITETDFYLLVAERYMGPDAMKIWDTYRAGEISHFDAMQAFFSHAPDDPAALDRLLQDVTPDPNFRQAVQQLEDRDWGLIIVSAGSSWYIDRILTRTGVHAVVHSNPGRIVPGRGLLMDDAGIDKSAIVKNALARYERVAFAGDGPPDVAPSRLVRSELRFARGFLAAELSRLGEPFRVYERWSEIVDWLIAHGS